MILYVLVLFMTVMHFGIMIYLIKHIKFVKVFIKILTENKLSRNWIHQ